MTEVGGAFVPLAGHPCGVLDAPDGKTLVFGDVHLGIEAELRRGGIVVPTQTDRLLEQVFEAVRRTGAPRVLFLGDVKHTIARTSAHEAREVPAFFHPLLEAGLEVDVLLGNHDVGLTGLLPDGVRTHRALVVGDVGFVHGHAWPPAAVARCAQIVIGHNHPTVRLTPGPPAGPPRSCWVRAPVRPSAMRARYPRGDPHATVIAAPSLTDLRGGTIVNQAGVRFLGPLLSPGFVDLRRAQVYLSDGLLLGDLGSLRRDLRGAQPPPVRRRSPVRRRAT